MNYIARHTTHAVTLHETLSGVGRGGAGRGGAGWGGVGRGDVTSQAIYTLAIYTLGDGQLHIGHIGQAAEHQVHVETQEKIKQRRLKFM